MVKLSLQSTLTKSSVECVLHEPSLADKIFCRVRTTWAMSGGLTHHCGLPLHAGIISILLPWIQDFSPHTQALDIRMHGCPSQCLMKHEKALLHLKRVSCLPIQITSWVCSETSPPRSITNTCWSTYNHCTKIFIGLFVHTYANAKSRSYTFV